MRELTAGTWLPEANVVFGAGRGQEIVNLLVDVHSPGQILFTANLSLDQVIAVHSRRRGDRGHTSGHELQDSHLSGGILASHAIGSEFKVRNTTLDVLTVRVIEMGVKDLFGVCERAIESASYNGEVLRHFPGYHQLQLS